MFHDVVLSIKPDLVIIFFGANDAVSADVLQHVPIDQYRLYLKNMLEALKVVSHIQYLFYIQ